MAFVQALNGANTIQSPLVTNMATQRIGRICWIGQHLALADDSDRLVNQAGLRVVGMDTEILAHVACLLFILDALRGPIVGDCRTASKVVNPRNFYIIHFSVHTLSARAHASQAQIPRLI